MNTFDLLNYLVSKSNLLKRSGDLQRSVENRVAVLVPFNLFAYSAPTYHFIQTATLKFWPIANPAQWCLDHKHDPILERAYDGLCSLSTIDADRIIRLVVRRCGLNLIHVQPNQVTVHHWSQQLADLRPFFKDHQLVIGEVLPLESLTSRFEHQTSLIGLRNRPATMTPQ